MPKSAVWFRSCPDGEAFAITIRTGPAGFWAFGGTLMQPILAGGRIKSGVKHSEALL